MKRAIIAAAAALFATAASAEFYSGNELLSRMQSTDIFDKAWTLGYISGAADAVMGISACPPKTITVQQVMDIVRKDLEAMPELRHYSADAFVAQSLRRLWPCAKQEQPKQRGSNL